MESVGKFRSVGVRFFENRGTAHRPVWQEDSTRVESVYQNPPGYQTWSSTLMHVDADSLLDLVVAFDSEGYFDVAFYSGVKDSFGDFDKDGCIDLFIGNRCGEILFFRNGTIVGAKEKVTETPRSL